MRASIIEIFVETTLRIGNEIINLKQVSWSWWINERRLERHFNDSHTVRMMLVSNKNVTCRMASAPAWIFSPKGTHQKRKSWNAGRISSTKSVISMCSCRYPKMSLSGRCNHLVRLEYPELTITIITWSDCCWMIGFLATLNHLSAYYERVTMIVFLKRVLKRRKSSLEAMYLVNGTCLAILFCAWISGINQKAFDELTSLPCFCIFSLDEKEASSS